MKEISIVRNLYWRKGWGEWIIGKGNQRIDVAFPWEAHWRGKYFLIGCPWFQITFERNWPS